MLETIKITRARTEIQRASTLIEALGEFFFDLSQDIESIDLPGYRPLALLAYLLVTRKAHSRQHLVDLLFDNTDDPRASLRWTLSKLRQAIGTDLR